MATLSVRAEVARRGPAGGTFALEVDTTFAPGVTCIMGPSGAGKSTLLGVIAGLVTPGRGRVALGDEVWLDTDQRRRVPVHKRHVAYLFQSLALFPHLNAIHNVEYSMPRGTPRRERHARAHALLERLGVAHLAHRRPRTFSGGEAQRVALARALAMAPRVILLDEPFSALDRALKIPLIALVRELALEAGVPTLAVTHSIGEARALADRVIQIAGGRVAADGGPDQLLPARVAYRDDRADERALEITPAPILTRR
jgi:molybdate transport system ATP-binding protein